MASFHTLPFELHSHIAYLSCLSDAGSSILSLSQVSRYLNRVSSPYLFHTVSVTAPNKISQLDSALQNHVSSNGNSSGVLLRNLYLGMNQPASPSERGTLVAAIARILSMSSSTLRTLTIDFSEAMQDSSLVLARVFRISFPKLEDLTLVGFYPNPTIPSPPSSRRPSLPPSPIAPTDNRVVPSEGTTIERTTNFPSVKRLHLSGNRNPSGLFSVGSLASVFPTLETLKVSGLSMAVGFVTDIHDSLSHASPQPLSPSTSAEGQSLAFDENLGRNGIQSLSFGSIDTNPFPLRASPTLFFVPRLPAKLRLLRVQPAPAIEPSTGPMPNTTAVTKDEGMMSLLHGLEETYGGAGEGQGMPSCDRVRFELLGRGRMERGEVWGNWRNDLRG